MVMWGCPELHGVWLQGGGGFGVECHSALVQAGTIHPWLAGGQTQGEQETVDKEVNNMVFSPSVRLIVTWYSLLA